MKSLDLHQVFNSSTMDWKQKKKESRAASSPLLFLSAGARSKVTEGRPLQGHRSQTIEWKHLEEHLQHAGIFPCTNQHSISPPNLLFTEYRMCCEKKEFKGFTAGLHLHFFIDRKYKPFHSCAVSVREKCKTLLRIKSNIFRLLRAFNYIFFFFFLQTTEM